MVQSDMSKSPPSPAQEVQMELLDNPLPAAAAAQVEDFIKGLWNGLSRLIAVACMDSMTVYGDPQFDRIPEGKPCLF
ncbi:unnamed protein product [Bubo scandiacus]